LLSNF